MKKGLFTLLMLVLMAVSANALTLDVQNGTPGYSTVSIVATVASPDSGTTAKKLYLYYDKVKATTLVDSITTVTIPDTFAVTGLDEGATYYFKVVAFDSATTVTGDVKSFTTTNFVQNNTLLYDGYSTTGIQSDSVGFYVAPLDSIVLNYGKVSGTYTLADTITSVTHPDTFALTGLDEGITYYYQSIAYIADSGIVDTSTQGSFTTTDLTYAVSVILARNDSIWIKADSSGDGLAVDSLQLHSGAGTVLAESISITTVTKPDTFIIAGIKEGEIHSWTVWAFLTDSSVVESTTTATYTKPHNLFMQNTKFRWPDNFVQHLSWAFDSHLDTYSTSTLPVQSDWIRIHVAIDGEDDFATSDSINVFLWSYEFGDATAIDTLVVLAADSITITPLKYRMTPNTDFSDSSLALYPPIDWGTHYSVSASMSNDDGQGDSTTTLGTRTVFVVIEEIE